MKRPVDCGKVSVSQASAGLKTHQESVPTTQEWSDSAPHTQIDDVKKKEGLLRPTGEDRREVKEGVEVNKTHVRTGVSMRCAHTPR